MRVITALSGEKSRLPVWHINCNREMCTCIRVVGVIKIIIMHIFCIALFWIRNELTALFTFASLVYMSNLSCSLCSSLQSQYRKSYQIDLGLPSPKFYCATRDWSALLQNSAVTTIFSLVWLITLRRRVWKIVYRLINLFLSTEIFSKRRKIFSFVEEKPEWSKTCFAVDPS